MNGAVAVALPKNSDGANDGANELVAVILLAVVAVTNGLSFVTGNWLFEASNVQDDADAMI